MQTVMPSETEADAVKAEFSGYAIASHAARAVADYADDGRGRPIAMPGDPVVSVGIPVYNGAEFLDEAIRSILCQTFSDLELVIVDNASEDATQSIAQTWASLDRRVRYVRNSENIGAAANFRRCYQLAKGRYFKWHAYDDLLDPKYIETCVDLLEQDRDAVLAHTAAKQIDEHGEVVGHIPNLVGESAIDPVGRFREIVVHERLGLQVFGLIRRDALGSTRLHGSYYAAARVELAELALRGRFLAADHELFVHRTHPDASVRAIHDDSEWAKWYDPNRDTLWYLPRWEYQLSLWTAVWKAPVSLPTKVRASLVLPGVAWVKRGALWRDLQGLGKRLIGRVMGR